MHTSISPAIWCLSAAPKLLRDTPVDADFLYDKDPVHMDTIKGTLQIIQMGSSNTVSHTAFPISIQQNALALHFKHRPVLNPRVLTPYHDSSLF
jgi:hypothetical protein